MASGEGLFGRKRKAKEAIATQFKVASPTKGACASSHTDHPPVGRTPRIGGSHANGDREEPCCEPARRKGRYPKEFRRDAAALVIDQHRTIADVARELGLVEQTLGNWVRQERIDRGEREGLTHRRSARRTPGCAGR